MCDKGEKCKTCGAVHHKSESHLGLTGLAARSGRAHSGLEGYGERNRIGLGRKITPVPKHR